MIMNNPFRETDQLRQRIVVLESQLADYRQESHQASQMRERLQQVECAFLLHQQALTAASQGVVIADRAEPHLPVLFANPAFARFAGVEAASFRGRPLDFLADWVANPSQADALREALRAGHTWAGELQLFPATGELRWAEVAVHPVVLEGTRRYQVGLITDISDRKNLHNQLLQSQKLETVGRLAGGIAHDFNNSLLVILGFCELLQSGTGLAQAEALAEIRRAGEMAVRLSRQLLAFSRKQQLAPCLVNVNALLTELNKMVRPLLGEDILLTLDLDDDPWLVKIDPGQFEQVILNLVVNARDAMPRGGRLTLETRKVRWDELSPERPKEMRAGRYMLVSVTDTGVGMDEATQQRIFEPFFTTKQASARTGAGTGLGLATAYGIVKQASGFLYVTSTIGVGSQFRVYLPARGSGSAPEDLPVVPSMADLQGRETILVVEDDTGVRNVVETVLAQHGYCVLSAATGSAALALSAQCRGPIALLITDVIMPEMNGWQLAGSLRSDRPLLKVLFFSGYNVDAVRRHAPIGDDQPFLEKPFTPLVLLRKVREVLDAGTC